MIDFTNAKVLSYNRTNDFWGEGFRFASKKELSIEGSIYDLTNGEGVSGIWSGINKIEQSDSDYEDIIIAGVNFGKGRVDSISFQEGNDVRIKGYTAQIVIFDSGNLFNLNGDYYSGLDFTNSNFPSQLLESFSENFDFNFSEDGKYTYSQDIDVKFISGAGIGQDNNPIEMAKLFASGLIYSSPLVGLTGQFPSGLYNNRGKRTYTESYNLISNECSFAENFELDTYSTGIYSIRYSNEIVTDENGVTTFNENGKIEGIEIDYNTSAEYGYGTEISRSFDRGTGLCAIYLPSGAYPLIRTHLSLKKSINKVDGTIDYSISYSNNPSINLGYVWEYTHELSKIEDCYYQIKEQGKIKGIYPCSFDWPVSKEEEAWSGPISSGASSRISGFYNQTTNNLNPLKKTSSSLRKHPFQSEIDYSFTYTDNLKYTESGFKSVEVNVTDHLPLSLVNKFNVINFKELVQPTKISQESRREVNISMVGERGTPLSGYLNKSKFLLNNLVPSGDDTFVESCNYTLTPQENQFTLNLGWVWFGDRNFEDVLL